jgi:hypothetical protein
VWHLFRLGHDLLLGQSKLATQPLGLLGFVAYIGILVGTSFAVERLIEHPLQRVLSSRLYSESPTNASSSVQGDSRIACETPEPKYAEA